MKTIRKFNPLFALSLLLLHQPGNLVAQTWDAASDFSATNNPTGVWSYGWSQTLGGTFTLDTATWSFSGIDLWLGAQSLDGAPVVGHNGTASPITSGSVYMEAGQLGMHPGLNGQTAVVRFTAPAAGSYALRAAFSGQDFVGPTTTDVHILVRGTSIFDGNINGFGPGSGPTISTNVSLNAGDMVDFAVGLGANGNYAYDSTALAATITSSPSNPPTLTIHPSVEICWPSVAGVRYQLQRSPSPHSVHWENVGQPVTGTGGELCVSDAHSGFTQRIYRLQVLR